MREILFRGQHRRYGEQVNMAGEKLPPVWVYGGVLQGEGDFSIIYGSKSPDGKFEEKYPVYTETLGQYTGITDKNGKKIFEGDIISVEFEEDSPECGMPPKWCENYIVAFDEVHHCWSTKISDMEDGEWLYEYDDGCATVIGNIHDNPELLKEATNESQVHYLLRRLYKLQLEKEQMQSWGARRYGRKRWLL